jgi:hypothetical protein
MLLPCLLHGTFLTALFLGCFVVYRRHVLCLMCNTFCGLQEPGFMCLMCNTRV